MNRMYLHIQFLNGSNPFLKYGTEKELNKELKKWEKNWDLLKEPVAGFINGKPGIIGYNVRAMEKKTFCDSFAPLF